MLLQSSLRLFFFHPSSPSSLLENEWAVSPSLINSLVDSDPSTSPDGTKNSDWDLRGT